VVDSLWPQFRHALGQSRGSNVAQKTARHRLLAQLCQSFIFHSTHKLQSSAGWTVLLLATSHTMLRTAAVRALRAASTPRIVRQLTSSRPQGALNGLLRSSQAAPSFVLPSIRCYSAPAGLSKDEVQGRIMDLLKNFDKVGFLASIAPSRSMLTVCPGYRCNKGTLFN
jgi:hypothetical protein